jgi:hypothetical protein
LCSDGFSILSTLLERLFPVLSDLPLLKLEWPLKVALPKPAHGYVKVVDSKSIGISIKAAGAL